jgi:beta-N-acetylhexosaminidase
VAQTKSLDPVLRHPLHGQFLALLGAVEKIKIDQLLVRKSGLLREALTSTDGQEFQKALKSRRPDADILYFQNRAGNAAGLDALRAAKEADELVIVVYVIHTGVRQIMVKGKLKTAFGPMGPSGRLLEDLLEVAPEKTAVIALGSPYLIESFPQIQTYICTYAMATSSEISAVKALFGEIQNHAKLPVTLPGVASRGFSLPWPQKETRPESAQAVH